MLGQHAYLRYVLQIQEDCSIVLSNLEHHNIGVRKAYNYTIAQVLDISQIEIHNDNHAYMLSKTNLALPMYPELTDDQVDFVIEKILEQF
jgi:dTDP-4-amino-4,6-dideoxygalactose transaminase